jgi:hypothetical protein
MKIEFLIKKGIDFCSLQYSEPLHNLFISYEILFNGTLVINNDSP